MHSQFICTSCLVNVSMFSSKTCYPKFSPSSSNRFPDKTFSLTCLTIESGENVADRIMYSVLTFIAKVDIRYVIYVDVMSVHAVLVFLIYAFFCTRPGTYLLHHELLNFLLIAMSTQLLSGPSPGPSEKHPFIDVVMNQVDCSGTGFNHTYPIIFPFLSVCFFLQESSLVDLVVNKLLLNYVIQPRVPLSSLLYSMFSESNQLGVLRRVGSAAGIIV